MALAAKDVRCTTRRAGDGDPYIYPRLLRDRAILVSIDVATQYFETMLGEQRRAFDSDTLVNFFGDYKVARGMVASLGRAYRYRTPNVDEIVTQTAARKLARAGRDRPGMLRALLWDEANRDGAGFLAGERRTAVVAATERRFALRSGELDELLSLDAPEHAILGRLGEVPRPADVLAEYRRSIVAALLAQAERVELTLRRPAAGQLDALRVLADVQRVEVDLAAEAGGGRVAVRSHADALGSWTRQGRRVARYVSRLLERTGGLVQDGTATLHLRGRRVRLRLNGETLEALRPGPESGAGWQPCVGWDDAAIAEALGHGRAASRGTAGWTARRDPEPRAWAAGALTPDLLIRPTVPGRAAGVLVVLVQAEAQAGRLAALAPSARGGEPLLFVGPPALLEPLAAAGAWTLPLEHPSLPAMLEAVSAQAVHDLADEAARRAARPIVRRRRVA
jgi:hypothetical protein